VTHGRTNEVSMTPLPVPQELLDFIRSGTKFLVAGHKEIDGDCVGSQLALDSFLRRLGKISIPCSSGPFKRPEVIPYQNRFVSQLSPSDLAESRVIVTDCSMAERIGDLEEQIKGLPTAVIDHHASGNPFGQVIYIDPHAPSVTFMIQGIIESFGMKPTKEEAELLFFGLCTDTGFFRHLDDRGAEAFEYAARMIRSGANPKATFQAINGGKSLDSRILMGRILTRAESHFGGKLILSTETLEDTKQFGLQGRDSDSLYQLLQSVAGVEAVVLIRQETEDHCSVGLRSRHEVDVASIAARFGGGGHKQAAGLNVPGLIPEIREKLLQSFSQYFDEG